MKKIAIVVNSLDNEQMFNAVELYKRFISTHLHTPLIVITSNNKELSSNTTQYFIGSEILHINLNSLTCISGIFEVKRKLKQHNIDTLLNLSSPLSGIINFLFKRTLKYKCITISGENVSKLTYHKTDFLYKTSFVPSKDDNTYPPIISSDLKGATFTKTCTYLVKLDNDSDTINLINHIINRKDMTAYYFNIFVNDISKFDYKSLKNSEYVKIHEYNYTTYNKCIKTCGGIITNPNKNTISDAIYANKPLLIYSPVQTSLFESLKTVDASICDRLSLHTLLSFIFTKHKPYKLTYSNWYRKKCLLIELPYIIKKS